jgi:pimeloyl-ACP methyl ester carboxylesterase
MMITTKDGTHLYYKDWGTGQPVVFSHGWPLTADAFEDQMFYLSSRGYRCIAHDRRGHGRSSQPWARPERLRSSLCLTDGTPADFSGDGLVRVAQPRRSIRVSIGVCTRHDPPESVGRGAA